MDTPVQPAHSDRCGRFNLKISKEFKLQFERPYDNFVYSLLGYTEDIIKEGHSLAVKKAIVDCPKGRTWTIWLSDRTRERFLNGKQKVFPSGTHGQFVNILLELRRAALGIQYVRTNPNIEDVVPLASTASPESDTTIAPQRAAIATGSGLEAGSSVTKGQHLSTGMQELAIESRKRHRSELEPMIGPTAKRVLSFGFLTAQDEPFQRVRVMSTYTPPPLVGHSIRRSKDKPLIPFEQRRLLINAGADIQPAAQRNQPSAYRNIQATQQLAPLVPGPSKSQYRRTSDTIVNTCDSNLNERQKMFVEERQRRHSFDLKWLQLAQIDTRSTQPQPGRPAKPRSIVDLLNPASR